MEFEFNHKGDTYRITVQKDKDRIIEAKIGNTSLKAQLTLQKEHQLSFMIGEKSYVADFAANADTVYVHLNGEQFRFNLPGRHDEQQFSDNRAAGRDNLILSAPMPGNVLKLNVSEGDSVTEGQNLAILEAMKMEHALVSALDGRVKKIYVAENDLVEAGARIIELERAK